MRPADASALGRIVDAAPEGIVLVDAVDPDRPVLYVNPAFERLTGFAAADLLGHNLRILQGTDRDQDGRQSLGEAIRREESCRVLMRNYRKDGTMFWNEICIVPLFEPPGRLTLYAGYHRDATERLKGRTAAAHDVRVPPLPVPVAVRDDRLTGLYSAAYLEELLKRDWSTAQSEQHSIAAFCIDVDALGLYNATFGRAAGDSAIRRVGHCIGGCLRRASDAVARIEGGNLLAFAPGVGGEQAMRIGNTMAERVRELRIHHPRSTVVRYVSVSVGVAAATPALDAQPASLLDQARRQLAVAKQLGRNRAA
ncbi:MAG TPA: diguanylate cyclase [Steroidobacteraceae bacterium]|nr:diguanylate cyclase [Steroidobacteraceae bacterium]